MRWPLRLFVLALSLVSASSVAAQHRNLRLAIFPPQLERDVDPVVGRHIVAAVRELATELHYEAVPMAVTELAARVFDRRIADDERTLEHATYACGAHRGIASRVTIDQRHYAIEIAIASLDGSDWFLMRSETDAQNFHRTLERIVREGLPDAAVWDASRETLAEGAFSEEQMRVFADDALPARHRRPARFALKRRWLLSVFVEPSFGLSQDSYLNVLSGMRAAYRISEHVALGVSLAYANLEGRDGRESNLLFMGTVEDRLRIANDFDLFVPLRVGVGYVPLNGPVGKVSVGLLYPVSKRVELGAEILAPTFWGYQDGVTFSFDFSTEATYRF